MVGNTIVEQAAHDMDKGLKSVMPPTWQGHARIIIDQNEDLSKEEKRFAKRLAKRVSEKKGVASAKAAEAAMKEAPKHV